MAIAGGTQLIDRQARSEQVEQSKSVAGKRLVQIRGNPERMASVVADEYLIAMACGSEIGEVKEMHRLPRRRFRSVLPRLSSATQSHRAIGSDDDEINRK
jgi:hypothetical protein